MGGELWRPKSGESSPSRALVVTDKELLAAAIAVALNHGAYVTRVASGRQALKTAGEWQPVIALIELESGGPLQKLIESLRALRHLPVIVLTSEAALPRPHYRGAWRPSMPARTTS